MKKSKWIDHANCYSVTKTENNTKSVTMGLYEAAKYARRNETVHITVEELQKYITNPIILLLH